MSHAATNWAIQQRGLKPATEIVLWFLCDRHNPDFGCFPTQARLAEDAEMSVSALNDHLAALEDPPVSGKLSAALLFLYFSGGRDRTMIWDIHWNARRQC